MKIDNENMLDITKPKAIIMKKLFTTLILITTTFTAQAKMFGDYDAQQGVGNVDKVAAVQMQDGTYLEVKTFKETQYIHAYVQGKPASIIADGVNLGTTLNKNEMVLFKNATAMQAITINGTIAFSTKGSGATAIWLTNDKLTTTKPKVVVKAEPKRTETEKKNITMFNRAVALYNADEVATMMGRCASVAAVMEAEQLQANYDQYLTKYLQKQGHSDALVNTIRSVSVLSMLEIQVARIQNEEAVIQLLTACKIDKYKFR